MIGADEGSEAKAAGDDKEMSFLREGKVVSRTDEDNKVSDLGGDLAVSALNTRPTLTFLGTGAVGVPSFYCDCCACKEAQDDSRARRNCCGLAIRAVNEQGEHAVTLIDTPPELRLQLVREGISDVKRVLFTHEHYDHIGGLPQLEFYVRLKRKTPLPVYAGTITAETITRQYDFISDVLDIHETEMFAAMEFDGVRYTMLPATHSEGTCGFLIEYKGRKTAYFPDTGKLKPATVERLTGVDRLIIDATFNGSNWMPDSHNNIDEALDTARALGAKETYLTHLAMHYDTPVTLAELEENLRLKAEKASNLGDVFVAHDGLTIEL